MIEAMSIREVKLRAVAGIVHTVPFSEVTVIQYLTGLFLLRCDAGILYREDTDRAIEAMRAAGKDIAEDKQWSRYILAPLEILGVERFTDTGMVIRARLKAAPPYQLELGREFNRRLKKTFDEHGIAMPLTSRPISTATTKAEPAAGQTPRNATARHPPPRSREPRRTPAHANPRRAQISLSCHRLLPRLRAPRHRATAKTRRARSSLKPARASAARSFCFHSARRSGSR